MRCFELGWQPTFWGHVVHSGRENCLQTIKELIPRQARLLGECRYRVRTESLLQLVGTDIPIRSHLDPGLCCLAMAGTGQAAARMRSCAWPSVKLFAPSKGAPASADAVSK